MTKARLGLDVGGTFTDLVLIDQSGRSYVCKVPSTPSDPAASSLTAIRTALQHAAFSAAELADIQHTHSNTLATNAVIERTGTRTGVLVTQGTRDLFELQRLALQNSNRFDAGRPQPLVPRSLVREVGGRIDHRGRELAPLDLDSVTAATNELIGLGCEAIAIVFLHSYANSQHELAAQRHIASFLPDLPVELSNDVWPQAREYERASLTVINASLRRLVAGYLEVLERTTRDLGLALPPMIARSNGGKQHARATAARPIATILSGPAANVAGAAAAAIAEGWKEADLVTIDVGGTSADIGLVRSGSVALSSDGQIGGIPILIPTVSVSAIGAGGNSIVAIDPNGRLKVGPGSLGSTPGPACYGQQGDTAGLSDAFLLCEWLSESVLLGGNVPLNRAGSEVVFDRLSQEFDADPVEVADGAIRVAVAAMASEATRFLARHTTDYSEFRLVASGGAGPLVAALLAEELHLANVLIPRFPGILSAIGAARSDLEGDLVVPVYRKLREMDDEEFSTLLARAANEIRQWAQAEVGTEDVDGLVTEWALDMRYFGQGYDLTVCIQPDWLTAEHIDAISNEFHRAHTENFGHASEGREVWIGELKVHLVQPSTSVPTMRENVATTPDEKSTREIWLRGRQQVAEVRHRSGLPEGATLLGPMIVLQDDCTVLIPDGWSAQVSRAGGLVMERIDQELTR